MSSQCTDVKCRQRGPTSPSFFKLNFKFLIQATLRITALPWQDGQNRMGTGSVKMKPLCFLTLMWWLYAGEAVFMGKE